MNILGLNAFHGDASAALLSDGQLVAAAEEERFNRTKHWAGFPAAAARYCLAGIDPAALGHVAISRNPRAHLWRKLARVALRPGDWGCLASRARNAARIAGLAGKLNRSGIAHTDQVRVHYVEHHRTHLASAFFVSPFEEAAVISIDGFGDYSSLMWGVGRGNRIEVRGSVRFPHSLGLFYTAFTQFLGFPKFGDEYKMMGLASYGEPRFAPQVRDVVRTEGGQVRLNLGYFIHHTAGVEMSWDDCAPAIGTVYSPRMVAAFGRPRVPRSEILDRHRDLAASAQTVLEENYFSILNFVQRETGLQNVCLAGGVALNCVANGMIFAKTDFRDAYVQPAAHDAGTSIGAALYVHHQVLDQPRAFVMRHVHCGPEYSDAEVDRALQAAGARYHRLSEDQLVGLVAAQIAEGKIVGWFQGRMEFGPRALGNRSILADPRRRDMKDILNRRIKYREPFRPFCPSVLAECAGDYFVNHHPSPFMVMAFKIKPQMRQTIPAVVHNDGTGRLQTVEKDVNPLYWKLIRAFGDCTGVPVLLNTSFNENEPIVNTPAEAIDCFLRTRMDVLAIGSYLLVKTENEHLSEGRGLAVAA
ncbi:MAG TPA: carbamoyltransferase C-terminal domain-containing protein [Bryobacteraceae bacterium]|nr:carbamoyltransferase C-terminal domain-containing protein [Bryobacteraceae bacterium]